MCPYQADYAERNTYRNYKVVWTKPNEDKISKELTDYGLNPFVLIPQWKQSGSYGIWDEWITINIVAIRALEKAMPGICKILFEKNSIHCFGRYPFEYLFNQMGYHDEAKPYGIISSASDDWNCSFFNPNFSKMLRMIHEEAKRLGIQIRLCEHKGTPDIIRSLEEMLPVDAKTEESKKAEFLWVNHHGSSTVMGAHVILAIENMWGKLLGEPENGDFPFIKKNGTIVTNMCFSGEPNNVMSKVRDVYHLNAIGPSIAPIGVKELLLKRDEIRDELEWQIEFEYDKYNRRFSEGKTVYYNSNE